MGSTAPDIAGPDRPVPVTDDEILRLIGYAAHRGLDPDGRITVPLYRLVEGRDRLNARDISTDKKIRLYTQLTRLTYAEAPVSRGVNGRTLIDTENCSGPYTIRVSLWGLFFLLMGIGAESIDAMFKTAPTYGKLLVLYRFHIYFLDLFSPFFWGGLGACVFLMKRLSDRIGSQCFDRDRWKGFGTRVLLGGLLGLISVYIYTPEGGFKTEHLNLDANALAFFAGVGVKVFYGAIEKTIDTLAEKFNIGSAGTGSDRRTG